MTDKDTVEALVGLCERLRTELDDAKRLLHDARAAACGVKIGDIVRCRGKRYRVVNIDTGFERPWLTGNPERKDGTFGTARRNLFNSWERETL